MNALKAIEAGLRQIGYAPETIIRDYTFADVMSERGPSRTMELAVFTQLPESYRSAAFGVVFEDAVLNEHRSLGAPVLFSIGKEDIGVWRVSANGGARLLERVGLDAILDLFTRNSERWHPQAVHRAKSLGQVHVAYQFDFIDLGLMPAIEHEVEVKLDRILREVVEELLRDTSVDLEASAFRTTFRLLAAKILLDREHPLAVDWDRAPVDAILLAIEGYYGLKRFPSPEANVLGNRVVHAWETLRNSINFRNISADSLAFVYENTLVTTDTRKRFGTHSTPRQVAEYVVGRLDLSRFNLNDLKIFEPFTGAGVFLVAALRHLRDLLPPDVSAEERHATLVARIRGAEIDAFACEVATLSLILADYPNANGWKIANEDLFEAEALNTQLKNANIVFCNPPWEDFSFAERETYPEMADMFFSKPMSVLMAALDAKPDGIGFVLPQGFLRQKQYAELRQRIVELYKHVELTSLPDRVFQRAGMEAAVLVATDRRIEAEDKNQPKKSSQTNTTSEVGALTRVVSVDVADRDRVEFMATGKLTAERRNTKFVTSGDVWIGELDELWVFVASYPQLQGKADIYRGLQWSEQSDGVANSFRKGFLPGVSRPAHSLEQFALRNTVYLNMSPGAAMFPGPLARPWSAPKVLTNVARLSRGPWRIAAASDRSGLVASQAFFGIWPTTDALPLEALEAILNGPLTNAFLTERASNQHFTNELFKKLPLPKGELTGIVDAVERYKAALEKYQQPTALAPDMDALLNRLLIEVDAEVLKAYDLPPRIERQLLEYFRGHAGGRRVGHSFVEWIPESFSAYMPLHEYLGPMVHNNLGAWTLDVFTPAPDEEVEALRQYIH